jgi:hypothetical protein
MNYKMKSFMNEAVQWKGNNEREMFDFITGTTGEPIALRGENFEIDLCNGGCCPGDIIIETNFGKKRVKKSEWVVKFPQGDFWSFTDRVFQYHYVEVVDAEEVRHLRDSLADALQRIEVLEQDVSAAQLTAFNYGQQVGDL